MESGGDKPRSAAMARHLESGAIAILHPSALTLILRLIESYGSVLRQTALNDIIVMMTQDDSVRRTLLSIDGWAEYIFRAVAFPANNDASSFRANDDVDSFPANKDATCVDANGDDDQNKCDNNHDNHNSCSKQHHKHSGNDHEMGHGPFVRAGIVPYMPSMVTWTCHVRYSNDATSAHDNTCTQHDPLRSCGVDRLRLRLSSETGHESGKIDTYMSSADQCTTDSDRKNRDEEQRDTHEERTSRLRYRRDVSGIRTLYSASNAEPRHGLDDELTDSENFMALYTLSAKTVKTVVSMSSSYKEGWTCVWQALCALYRNQAFLTLFTERWYASGEQLSLDVCHVKLARCMCTLHYVHVCMHVCTCVYAYVCAGSIVCMYACMLVCMCVCVRTYLYYA